MSAEGINSDILHCGYGFVLMGTTDILSPTSLCWVRIVYLFNRSVKTHYLCLYTVFTCRPTFCIRVL